MSKTSSAAKNRWNKGAYDRHSFVVDKDSELAHRLLAEANVSGLVKQLLCSHYGIDLDDRHDYLQIDGQIDLAQLQDDAADQRRRRRTKWT